MKQITIFIRQQMIVIAVIINRLSRQKIKPANITTLSILGHVPVVLALLEYRPILAAILLSFFSLLDALDGALARVQNTASRQGMFFDAVSDRIKEILVYAALLVFADATIQSDTILWQIVALCGTSLLVSYTKAKGEMAISDHNSAADVQKLNRLFGGGFASYEIRITAIIAGLLFGWTVYVVPLLIAANSITVATRFVKISKELSKIDKKERSLHGEN